MGGEGRLSQGREALERGATGKEQEGQGGVVAGRIKENRAGSIKNDDNHAAIRGIRLLSGC